MRVEAANLLSDKAARIEFPWKNAGGREYLDLRGNPGAITEIPAARENPPFARFLLELNEEGSLFRTVRAKTWATPSEQAGGGDSFHSQIDLIFAHDPFNTMSERFEDVVRRLVELWMKDFSADTLAARLEILPCNYKVSGCDGAALRITLTARGANADQARTRWGLGLVRLQQAILFVSRAMKQKLGMNT
jgi:hypothetical protein